MCFTKQIRQIFYNDSSHGIMNLLTLQIKDKEIERKLDESRSENLTRAFWPVVFLTLGMFCYYLINFFNGAYSTPALLIGSAIHLSLVLLWWIMRKRFNSWTPKLTTLFLLIQCIMTDLSFHNMLPENLIESDTGG